MNLAIMFFFFVMVLAPCFVALWGLLRAQPDKSLDDETGAVPEAIPATLPRRSVRDLLDHLARRAFMRPPASAPREPMPAALSTPTLDDLLYEAVHEARVAKAAAMRADAAASHVAARLAAARVVAATEAAQVSRRMANEAATTAEAAQLAYEDLLARKAEIAAREMSMVTAREHDRRAA